MFPFTPSHVKQANLYLEEAAKLVAYRRDIVTQNTIDAVQQCISALKLSLQSKDKAAIEGAMRNLDDACRDLAPPLRNGSWRENVEVFVVAISIALGVRTYFVQPFTIPTGSMQPTLNGIITKPTNNPPPNIAQRAVEWFVLGRDYFQIIAKRSERVVDIQERHAFGIKLGLATYSVVVTDQGEYSAYVPLAALKADLRCSPGRKVEPGAIIACGECNIELPFETYARLSSNSDSVIQCKACTRILYLAEANRPAGEKGVKSTRTQEEQDRLDKAKFEKTRKL